MIILKKEFNRKRRKNCRIEKNIIKKGWKLQKKGKNSIKRFKKSRKKEHNPGRKGKILLKQNKGLEIGTHLFKTK